MLLFEATGDLLWRPRADQAAADGFVEVRIVQFADQRALAAPALCVSIRLGGEVIATGMISPQLAADGARISIQGGRNFLLIGTSAPWCRNCAMRSRSSNVR
jgi:hypothetical protein